MKTKIAAGVLAMLSAGAIVWAAKDPIVMTVNGVDVPRSEFEYLYHKNSQQQDAESGSRQGLGEYVGLFELYKMKVADAKAAGIDTTAAYISEMKQYSRDLATPYITDSVYLNKLVSEAYANSLLEAEANHIMLSKGRTAQENARALELADSIIKALKAGADFDQLAKKYSIDRNAAFNGGHMGYIAAGRYPYTFEKAVYSLKPGEISDVVETSVGYHIIKGGAKRPSSGSIQVSHIMKMVRPGSTPELEQKAKAAIDSLYEMVMEDPSSFSTIAQTSSEDPGSLRVGGALGWITVGQMVPEFQDAAFSLAVNEVSKPVKSQFGWHIIKKTGEKGPRTREEVKAEVLQRATDPRADIDRYRMIRDNRIAKLAKKHKAKENNVLKDKVRNYIKANGVDSAFYTIYGSSPETIFTIDGKNTPISVVVDALGYSIVPDPYQGLTGFDEFYIRQYDDMLMTAEEAWLEANVADYRNLLNEYRDGSLLYEISKQNVWDKASQDTEGLEKYFQSHRSEYKWSEPKAKGYLVQAKNDSVADALKARFAELSADKEGAVQTLRKEFRNQAVIDRVLASKGVNKMVDYLMFDGEAAEPNAKYPVFFMIDQSVIAAPEEAADVKGQVTTDYQNQLEKEWEADMRSRYKVNLNQSELNKIK